MDILLRLDQELLLLVNGNWTPFLDSFMRGVSSPLVWIPLYLCIIFVRYRTVKFSYALFAFLLTIGVTFFFTDFFCSQIIRPAFHRLRPVSVENPVHELVRAVEGFRHGSCGFPSCHASNTMGLATVIWLTFRHGPTSSFMFLWSLANCYSRVYLAVHYPGDVIVGMIVGFLVGCAVYFSLKALAVKCLPKLPEKFRVMFVTEYQASLTVNCKDVKFIPIAGLSLFLLIILYTL